MKPGTKIEKIYTLSPMQEGMLFHYLLDGKSKVYIDQYVFNIRGTIDEGLFTESLNILVERYEVLRTIFRYEEVQQPLQIVLKKRKFKIEFKDISFLPDEKKAKEMEELKKKDLELGFDLTRDHLMRVLLIDTGKELYQLIWSFHHILMDGWCLGIIFRDLLHIYSILKRGSPVELEPVTPYSEYIKWLGKQNLEKGLDYWQKYLRGYETSIQMTGEANRARVGTGEFRLSSYSSNLDTPLTGSVINTAAALQVTINTLCQGAWGILLQKYNNSDDVVFGAVVSGRPPEIPGIDRMVGLFVNTIPIRVRTEPKESFRQLMGKLHQDAIFAKDYEYLSLGKIQAHCSIKNQLVNHILVFDNYPVHEVVDQAAAVRELGFIIETPVEFREQTNFDLTITIWKTKQLHIRFDFNNLVYKQDFIEETAKRFMLVLSQVTANPAITMDQIEIISPEEKKWLLDECNNTDKPFPEDKTIDGLFAEQVEQKPDNIALIGYSGIEYRPYMTHMTYISYGQSNEKANQLARVLLEKGVKPDTIVGIKVERSIEMIIGIFAVLKAGGAYLPIDPSYPDDRIDYMLKDSGAIVLLTSDAINRVPTPRLLNLRLSTLLPISPTLLSSHLYLSPAPVTSLAYVIYTSGSTGRPKGTAVQHHSLVNRLSWMQNKYPLDERDTILHKTPFTFDVSVWEIFWWSIVGASVSLLVSGGEKDPGIITGTVARDQVTVIHFVPSMFNAFLDYLEEKKNFKQLSCLNQVFCSGEALSASQVKRFNHRLAFENSTALANLYGPTEATIDVSYYNCPADESREIIPIGKPIDNIQLYILDKHYHLQPKGITGELYIAGTGLARGYLNNPELTAQKFHIHNQRWYCKSYRSNKSYITYKTGDLARWLPDGNIEFLGRIDFQVKIRGFRIETGEIETRLREHEKIKEAVVLDQIEKDSDRYLCAYFVACSQDEAREFSVSGLREYLSGKLPYYMVPQYFVKVNRIPLTPSGKVNRKALYFQGTPLAAGTAHAEPGNELEKTVARAWQEILQVDKVGIYDNFFDIGGDSLKIIRLTQRLNRLLKMDIPVVEVFEHLTIESFVKYLQLSGETGGAGDAAEVDNSGDRGGIVVESRKTSAQRRARRTRRNHHV